MTGATAKQTSHHAIAHVHVMSHFLEGQRVMHEIISHSDTCPGSHNLFDLQEKYFSSYRGDSRNGSTYCVWTKIGEMSIF